MLLVVSLLLGLAGLYIVRWSLGAWKTLKRLPPGPPSKPIIGNLLDLPSPGTPDWLHWLKHKALYGPISSVTIFGQTLVIINDHQVVVDLMEKRSGLHSSRPHLPIAEITDWKDTLGLLPYNSWFRAYRKALHQEMGTIASISKYHNIIDMETHRLVFRILDNPDDLIQHIRKEAGSIILRVGYGYITESHARDPLVDLVDKGMEDFSQLVLPGAWLVNFIPILKYLPSWFPGSGWQETAKAYKKRVTAMRDVPYEFVRRQLKQQKYVPSYVSSLLEQGHVEPGSEEEIVAKWSAQSLYGGGAETSVSSLACFFQAMVLNPEVQKKAQEEIDRVVGTSRLPEMSDCESLPYINAVVKEVLRWHPVTPLGVSHASSEDDTYEGYLIPKGAILVPNIWAIAHDPDLYHDPLEFKPERFLSDNGRTPEYDPHLLAFGFGRRICPGQHLADANLYLAVARCLAVFNITNAVRDGKEVPVTPEFSTGVISHPVPFELSICVRSPEHERLIRAVEKSFPWEKSHAEELTLLET
ncbi:O-methylsterigmatocystin oxidoreductase [Aspergillus bombycis]|uniref:O-methylsterigmatocystin oxidoreductase n=1 Tax=Aspergillus bombycis TaxID=109264 RepID=A0A1F8AAI4_9EURO|nr:O-methylsterigmatocystin oxidoreductase [Aspergillus bombycis]OGM48730.1 O-methylsterigmatocystin oxidoreductase [Aspergillus bombycis]